MDESTKYHQLAKDAGNKLRAYVLSVASGGTGIFFFSLTNTNVVQYSDVEKLLLLLALIGFVLTVVLSLYELRLDAQRFFLIAKEYEKQETERSWDNNDKLKKKRLCVINLTYFTLGIAILSLSAYLVLRFTKTPTLSIKNQTSSTYINLGTVYQLNCDTITLLQGVQEYKKI